MYPILPTLDFDNLFFGLSEDCCVGERVGGELGLVGLGREDVFSVVSVVSVVGDVGKGSLICSICSVSAISSMIGGGNESRANTFFLAFRLRLPGLRVKSVYVFGACVGELMLRSATLGRQILTGSTNTLGTVILSVLGGMVVLVGTLALLLLSCRGVVVLSVVSSIVLL